LFTLVLSLLWTLLLAGAVANSYLNLRKATRDAAYHAARTALTKDLVYRRWNAAHGGIYVPVTPDTPPNPYLDVPDRDIPGPGGEPLTLINPAYMTRQVNELFQAETDIHTKLTSLRPLNPANAPDGWEQSALETLDKGAPEVTALASLKDQESFRLMIPFRVEKYCLKCHARQGYQLGDMRGGIVCSIAMQPFREAMRAQLLTSGLNLGVLWLSGLVGLGLVFRLLSGQVSLRRAVETELAQSEYLLRESSKLGRIGGCELDAQSGEILCTEGFRDLFCLPPHCPLSLDRFIEAAQDPEECQALRAALGRAADSGEEFAQEVRLAGPGASRWVRIQGRRSPAVENRVLLMIQDITARKEFEQLRADMERIVRHDLKGPLTSIIGLSDITLDSNLTPDQVESLRYIQDAGYKMLRMINSLMNLAKIEDGTFTLQPVRVDVLPVLDEILKELEPIARKRRLRCAILVNGEPRRPEREFPVLGEEILVYSLLFNLAQNAHEAAPAESTVTFTLEGGSRGRIAVHNRGVVPAVIRDRFFGKYVSAGKTTGTGLGAYSAKLFTEAQGGGIVMDTSEQHGTTITVLLPC
jgi:signal transduction histidine kinase